MHTFINHAKTAMLMGGLMGLFILVGAQWGMGGMVFALVIGLVMNVGAFLFSDTIAVKAMQGREVTAQGGPGIPGAMSPQELYATVDRLRQRAGLPMPRVYVCPHDAPNAFATGRSPKRSAVAVTQGLMRMLDRDELEGVIAHELAHIKNRDTLISTISATIAGVLAFVAQWSFFLMPSREGGNPLVMLLSVIIAAVGAAVIKAMISRSREFIADADGAEIAGSPHGLIGALAKIDHAARRIPLRQPNPAQNNLFIIEPLAGGGNTLMRLFASHPPTEKRIAALRNL
jgi:heat shock protein HtpX